MDTSDVSSGTVHFSMLQQGLPACICTSLLEVILLCEGAHCWCLFMDRSGQYWNSAQFLLQAMSVTEWRAALWGVLHGTYISKPSQQSHISTFQEHVFVFTWLRLQKAVDKLLRTATESGPELDSVTELQRLQGIANQVIQALLHVPCM